MESLKELLDSRAQRVKDARAILNRADADKRALTAEETQEYERHDAEIDALSAKIDGRQADAGRRAKLAGIEASLSEPMPRQTQPSQIGATPAAAKVEAQAHKLKLRGARLLLQPGTPEHERCGADYRQKFLRYLASGGKETLGLQIAKDPKGGYLAPITLVQKLIKFLDDNVFVRQLATVLPPVDGKGVGVPSYDTDPGDGDWTPEVPASDIAEDDTAAFGRRELVPHLVSKLVKMSRKMTRNPFLDVEEFMAGRLGYKFSITEEKAYLSGTGVQQPLGMFTASADGISTGRDVAASSTTAFTADDLINCKFNVKQAYMARGTWLMSREGVKRARKLKDGNGQYLWEAGIGGTPGTILDRPYVMSEYVPSTYTTGLYVALFGDISYYWIADSLELEIQVLEELFALRNQVGLLGRKETDAMPVLEEAFSRLKLA